MKNLFFLLVFVFVSVLASAQKLGWKAGMFHFFDNTEFSGSTFVQDQTMAGLRFLPQVGLVVDQKHQMWVGVDALKTYGSIPFIDKISPTAYYLYDSGAFRFQMGRFSKIGQLDEFSRAFFQDSIYFYRPNINGFLLSWNKGDFQAKAFLDWTGKQDSTVHEAFFVAASARYSKSLFFAAFQGSMFHHAGSLSLSGVRDNFLFHPAVGLDLKSLSWMEALNVSIGWLGGVERHRSLTDAFTVRNGLLLELGAHYHGFGLQTSSYWGDGLMIDYASMGSELYWGDPFYRGKTYHRFDVSYDFLKTSFAKARLSLSNHISEGNFYVEQSLVVQIALHSNSN